MLNTLREELLPTTHLLHLLLCLWGGFASMVLPAACSYKQKHFLFYFFHSGILTRLHKAFKRLCRVCVCREERLHFICLSSKVTTGRKEPQDYSHIQHCIKVHTKSHHFNLHQKKKLHSLGAQNVYTKVDGDTSKIKNSVWSKIVNQL